MSYKHHGPKYDRKSHPTIYRGKEYPSYSEAKCVQVLTEEGIPFRHAPKYTLTTPRRKPVIYYPDCVFEGLRHPIGLPWEIDFIEVKGPISKAAVTKLHLMRRHGKIGMFLTLEFFKLWEAFGMFETSHTDLIVRDNPARLVLKELLCKKFRAKQVGHYTEVSLQYNTKSCVVDISFNKPTYLPGILNPIDYLHIIENENDFQHSMIRIQELLRRREKKKNLFFATRSYVDFWLYNW